MKKKIINTFFIQFLIIIVGLFLIKLAINKSWEKEFNRFDYDKALKTTTKYLNENEEQLKIIVDELYDSKSSIKNPLEIINNSSYEYDKYFDYKNEMEYIKFDIDAQGMLGGQNYGLIYLKENKEELIIYDEKYGNNIFIRQKLKDNWYFYYDDYDGKVDVDKIRKTLIIETR